MPLTDPCGSLAGTSRDELTIAGAASGTPLTAHTATIMTAADFVTTTPAANSKTQVLSSMHQDYVHHVAFDTYGRRMATCSGDRCVRVWDLSDTGAWTLIAEWQAHRGAVTHLSWAHPEFGSLLATCGADHEVKIWEERSSNVTSGSMPSTSNMSSGMGPGAGASAAGGGGGEGNAASAAPSSSRWTMRSQLTESRRAVSCLEFAPRHLGLKLATGSADGCVRIYEAVDVMNLSQWPLAATLQVVPQQSSDQHVGVTCVSWSTGRFEPATLVVGGHGGTLVIYRYNDAARQWLTVLALPQPAGGDVRDVAWAPNVGRRYHAIASAEGSQLRIFRLRRTSRAADDGDHEEAGSKTTSGGNKGGAKAGGRAGKDRDGDSGHKTVSTLELESTQTISSSDAWRCQWNVTGTVLASSGDRGVVQLWKADLDHQFQCVSKIQGDVSQA